MKPIVFKDIEEEDFLCIYGKYGRKKQVVIVKTLKCDSTKKMENRKVKVVLIDGLQFSLDSQSGDIRKTPKKFFERPHTLDINVEILHNIFLMSNEDVLKHIMAEQI